MGKRFLSLLLVTVLVASIIVGCAKKKEEKTQDVSSVGSGKFNEFGWEIPNETLTIRILSAGGFDAPTQAEEEGRKNAINYLKDNFNVDIKVQYNSGDGKEALNLALTTNDYPDIIMGMSYDMMKKFKDLGKAQELTPYMDTVGKDIKKSMGEHYPLFLDGDGKLYYVPTMMGSIDELPNDSAHIRYDEWKEIGSPEINTPEDYYNAINKILQLHPTTPTGEKRYAISFYFGDNGYCDPATYSGFWGLKKGFKINDKNEFTYWAFTEEGKKMTKFFNQFYLDGTLDPDAFANNFEQWMAKFSNERIVGMIGSWWITWHAGHEVWQTTQKDLPEDKRYIHVSFKDKDAEAAYISPKNYLGGQCTIITDKANNVGDLLKFINWQATERGRALTNWGIPNGTPIGDSGKEGKFWNIDKDGKWEVAPEAKEALVNEKWDYQIEKYWNSFPVLFADESRWEDGIHNIWPNQMWYEENKWKTIMIKNMKGTIYDGSDLVLRDKDLDTEITIQAVTDAWKTNWGKCVQANNDKEFDAAWKNLQDALTAAGVKKYEEVMQANYIKNKKKEKN